MKRHLLEAGLLSAVVIGLVRVAGAALIPPFYMDCVVAIGYRPLVVTKNRESKTQVERGKFVAIGSGFLYGDFVRKLSHDANEYRVYVVTNWHVLEEIERVENRQIQELSRMATFQEVPKVYLRFNPKNGKPARDDFYLPFRKPDGTPTVLYEQESDVAVVGILPGVLEKAGIQFAIFRSDQDTANRAKAKELGLAEGDGVYALGFPLRLVGGDRNFVIVRQGAIARIGDFLGGSSREFLIDMFIFPGNSGGPVVLKPEAMAIQNTKSQSRAYLIGLARRYIPYEEVALSTQTKRPRITFEENSGLAAVIPMDVVEDLVKEHRNTLKE